MRTRARSRRWINGTIAGTIYALRQTKAIVASEKHSAVFKVANVLVLALQALGFFLMFLTPGLFGFLFGSAAGALGTLAFGSAAELPLRVLVMATYGALYVVFVACHLKHIGSHDCVLRPTLTKIVIGYNAVLAVMVLVAIVANFVIEGAWFLLAVYASVPGCPILCACIGGDFEGALLMAKSFPVFALASPSFVGSLSAYSAARIADLTWGNRPASSQKDNEKRRQSLSLDDNRMKLHHWLVRQARFMYALNFCLVLANLGLMCGGHWLVPRLAFLPSFDPSWTLANTIAGSFFEGAIELYLIFSFAWLTQQIIGLLHHSTKTLLFGCSSLRSLLGWLAAQLARCACCSAGLTIGSASLGSAQKHRTWRMAYDELCCHLYAAHIVSYRVNYKRRQRGWDQAGLKIKGALAFSGEAKGGIRAVVPRKASAKIHPAAPELSPDQSAPSPLPSPPASPPVAAPKEGAGERAACEYEEMLCERPIAGPAIPAEASMEEARAVYAARADGKHHANGQVVEDLIQAERAWACACASSFHLVHACKRRDETTLRRRWSLHASGAGGHAATADMLIRATEEGTLDSRAWDLIDELNERAAKPYRVPHPMAGAASGVVTLAIQPNETTADVLSKLAVATGTPSTTAALAFVPPPLVGAAGGEELRPIVLSSGEPLTRKVGARRLADAGIDNGDLLHLGSPPRPATRYVFVELPSPLHQVFGTYVVLPLDAKESASGVKEKLQLLTCIPQASQELSYEREVPPVSIPDAAVVECSQDPLDQRTDPVTLYLSLKHASSIPGLKYTINVAIPPAPNHVRVAEGTVGQLKARLRHTTGLDPSEQSLFVLGRSRLQSTDSGLAPADTSLVVVPGDTVQLASVPTSETVVVRLPPSLCTVYGPAIRVAAGATDTIGDLKQKVAEIIDVPPALQALSCRGAPLVQDAATLSAVGMLDRDSHAHQTHRSDAIGARGRPQRNLDLALLAKTPSLPAGMVDIAVPPPVGHVCIAAESTTSIAQIKSKIAMATGYSASDIDVMLDDELLEEDASSAEQVGLANGDLLDLEVTKTDTPPATVAVALPRSMHAAFGPVIKVAVSPPDTAADVKARVATITGVPERSMQSLSAAEKRLGDEDILGAAGVLESGEPLTLTLNEPPPTPQMLLTIAAPWFRRKASALPMPTPDAAGEAGAPNLPDGSVRIAARPDASIGELKSAIRDATGLEPLDQILKIGDAAIFDDDCSLEMTGIEHGSSVSLHTITPHDPPATVAVALPRSMHAAFGPVIKVAVSPPDTAADVKARVATITGVPERSMQSLSAAEKRLGDEDILGAAGVLESGEPLTLTLNEPPPTPRCLISVTPTYINADTFSEQLLSANALDATMPERLLQQHKQRLSPGLVDKTSERLEAIQAADAAMRKAIDNILSRALSPPLEARNHRDVLDEHEPRSSPSTTSHLKALLANMDAADAVLRAALATDPLTKAVLSAALDRHGDTASPSLCRQVEDRMQELEDADDQVKAAIEAIAGHERRPSTAHEAQELRDVLRKHGHRASQSLCHTLSIQLDDMDASDAVLTRAIEAGGDGGGGDGTADAVVQLRDALLTHGPTSSPSLEAVAKSKLDELDPSRQASLQVEHAQLSSAPRQHGSSGRGYMVDAASAAQPKAHQAVRVFHQKLEWKQSYKVDDRNEWQPLRRTHHATAVFHKKQDWSQVQSRWHENNRWRGKPSKNNVIADPSVAHMYRRPAALATIPQSPSPQRKAPTEELPSRGRRKSVVDTIGDGLQSLFGVKQKAKPRGNYGSADEKGGIYASLHVTPLSDGPEGGGGLRIGPPHLDEPTQGAPQIMKRMRASLKSLFHADG